MSHPLFEVGDFLVSQGVCLGDNGDEINFLMQPTHELDVYLF